MNPMRIQETKVLVTMLEENNITNKKSNKILLLKLNQHGGRDVA